MTKDRVGLTALGTLLRIKEIVSGQIDLRVGAYSPLGFRNDKPDRWTLLVEGATQADFVGLLPERDDKAEYPQHIGFEDSCRRGLLLVKQLGKPIHIHVDQANHQHEGAAEIVARIARYMGMSCSQGSEPYIWLIQPDFTFNI